MYIDLLLSSVTKSVNASLTGDCFPHKCVIPLINLVNKPSLPSENLKNYRPVSGFLFMSKLVDWAVVGHFNNHINSNQSNDPFHSAYMSGYSTQTACLVKYWKCGPPLFGTLWAYCSHPWIVYSLWYYRPWITLFPGLVCLEQHYSSLLPIWPIGIRLLRIVLHFPKCMSLFVMLFLAA